jgi:hypothetical protein
LSDTDSTASAFPEPDGNERLTLDQQVGHYMTMWKTSVEVQQHFNDIEWRIRGLALTVATFALGAAGLAVKDRTEVGEVSLGAIITFVGLLLWYAFYFVDRAWYHPLLKGAVTGGSKIEDAIKASLPEAGLTRAITASSTFDPPKWVKVLRRNNEPMQSDDKLAWFYGVGATALILVTIALQVSAWVTEPKANKAPQEVIVHVDHGGDTVPKGGPTKHPAHASKQ